MEPITRKFFWRLLRIGQANFANRVRTFGAAVPASAMQHITLGWRSAPGSLPGRSEK